MWESCFIFRALWSDPRSWQPSSCGCQQNRGSHDSLCHAGCLWAQCRYTGPSASVWSYVTGIDTFHLCSGMSQVLTLYTCVLVCHRYWHPALVFWYFTGIYTWQLCSGMSQVLTLYTCVLVCHRYWHFTLVFWYVTGIDTFHLCSGMSQVLTLLHLRSGIMCIHRPWSFCMIPCHRCLYSVLLFWY